MRKQSPTCHVQGAGGSVTNVLQREKFACVWGWKQRRLFQHYNKLFPRAQSLSWHGSPWKLYAHSSLCRSFKSVVLEWTILVLARSYIYCPPGLQIGVEQQTSFLSDIHCFSYIHDVPEYYCCIPVNQVILGCKIYFNRLVTQKKKKSSLPYWLVLFAMPSSTTADVTMMGWG